MSSLGVGPPHPHRCTWTVPSGEASYQRRKVEGRSGYFRTLHWQRGSGLTPKTISALCYYSSKTYVGLGAILVKFFVCCVAFQNLPQVQHQQFEKDTLILTEMCPVFNASRFAGWAEATWKPIFHNFTPYWGDQNWIPQGLLAVVKILFRSWCGPLWVQHINIFTTRIFQIF